MNFEKVGGMIMKGYVQNYRVFPVVGDVTEVDTIEEWWEICVKAWMRFKNG